MQAALEQTKELIGLQLQHGTISSPDGLVHVIQNVGEGVAAVQRTPAALSAILNQRSPPAWAIEASKGIFLDMSSRDPSSDAVVDLGEVCAVSFLAVARIKLCWVAPTHSSSIASLPRHIQFLLLELTAGGPYAIILPLLPNNSKATLQPSSKQPASGNGLAVHLDSGSPDFRRNRWQAAVFVAAGADPFLLCDVAVAAAACVAGGAKPRWTKQLPEIAHCLGWCTWDAFYHDVSAQGVAAGLHSLNQAGIKPRWIIIDDGWQRTGLDRTAAALEQQLRQQEGSSALLGQPGGRQWLEAVRRWVQLVIKRLLRTVCGWVHWRCCWRLLLAVLQHPATPSLASWLLQAYNRATSEHSKRLLSSYQSNAKFSGWDAGPTADTSTASTSAQVLSCVQHIKQQYGIKHVFAWHATMGYWSGVSPAAVAVDAAAAAAQPSQLASGRGAGSCTADTAAAAAAAADASAATVVLPRVTPIMSDLEPPTNWSQAVLAGIGAPIDPHKFYVQLHSQLAAVGITGVKVDVQNQLELVGSAAGQQGGQVLAQAWHAALEDSVAAHFPGNALINCMCHNTSDLYRMRDSSLARVSDDFYPRLPASHTTHVAVCAYNSLFFAPLVQPDWDMFHSLHPRAVLHATARMISGGPVYVSDKPGRHDPSLLARLALPGGRLLQPLLPGRPCRDSLFVDACGDGSSALKVWNINACGGVLALFNVQGANWSRSAFDFVTHNHKPPVVTAMAKPADVWALSSCLQQAHGGCDEHAAAAATQQQPGRLLPAADAAAAGSSRVSSGICLGPGLTHTGAFVLHRVSSGALTVVDGQDSGITVQLAAAESEVITVSPVLRLAAGSSGGSSSGSCSSQEAGMVFAVVGLVNMLNPGGAVQAIRVTHDQQQPSELARSSDGSNNGSSSSNNDSGSWVMAPSATTPGPAVNASTAQLQAVVAGPETARGQVPGEGASVDFGGAAAAAAAAGGVAVDFVGCGVLLVYSRLRPQAVLLDGELVGFSFNPGSCVVEVVVPIGAGHHWQHTLVVQWA